MKGMTFKMRSIFTRVRIKLNHPERCLSVDSSSSVSATSDRNPVKASSSQNSVEQNDDVLVRPKLKEVSHRKRKIGINQRSVCLTDDDCVVWLKKKRCRKRMMS